MNRLETNANISLDAAFRRAASFFPSGVVIVAAADAHGAACGFTADSFCALSCEPPLVALSVARDSAGLASLRGCGCFSISVLSEDQAQLAKRFGTSGTSHFDDSSSYTMEAGAPIVSGAALHLTCELEEVVDVGDHCLVISAVRRVAMPSMGKPLVYWRRNFFRLHLDYPFLASGEALAQFVSAWELAALNPREWTHPAHVAATAYYAFHRSPEEVFQAMKEGINKFNAAAGAGNGPDSGYHETLTRFWSNVISSLINRRTFASPLDAAREAAKRYGEERDLHHLYYSFDVARSRQARREWMPPDREPSANWY